MYCPCIIADICRLLTEVDLCCARPKPSFPIEPLLRKTTELRCELLPAGMVWAVREAVHLAGQSPANHRGELLVTLSWAQDGRRNHCKADTQPQKPTRSLQCQYSRPQDFWAPEVLLCSVLSGLPCYVHAL